jgi:hypothetical protein
MTDLAYTLAVYLRLAVASLLRRRPHVCDRFLLLAGVTADELEFDSIAVGCRAHVLRHNPQHQLRRWSTFAMALEHEDFVCLLRQVRRRYPQEKAEQLLQSLDIDVLEEREAHFSDLAYAATLLDELAAVGDKLS